MHHIYKQFELLKNVYLHETGPALERQLEIEDEFESNDQSEMGIEELDKLIEKTSTKRQEKKEKANKVYDQAKKKASRADRIRARGNELKIKANDPEINERRAIWLSNRAERKYGRAAELDSKAQYLKDQADVLTLMSEANPEFGLRLDRLYKVSKKASSELQNTLGDRIDSTPSSLLKDQLLIKLMGTKFLEDMNFIQQRIERVNRIPLTVGSRQFLLSLDENHLLQIEEFNGNLLDVI